MRARHRRPGRGLGSFFVAASAALTLFLALGIVFDTFSSLGSVELTQAEGKDKPKDKCKPKDKDGNDTDNNNGSGGGQGNKKPCPTPSPSPSPTCSPGGYGVPPVCPSVPPVAGGSSSGDGTGGVPGTGVLGGTTVAQGGTSTTGGTTTGSATTGSTTPQDAKGKAKGGGTEGSTATGGTASGSPETRVLGETLTRPEGSSETRAAGSDGSSDGTELLGWVVPLEGAAFGVTALLLVAVVGLFLFLLIKRRKRTESSDLD